MKSQCIDSALGKPISRCCKQTILLITILMGSIWCNGSAISQTQESSQAPLAAIESDEIKVEFKNQSDISIESMQGFHQVPLTDLPSALAIEDSKAVSPSEIKTRARVINGRLVGSSELIFPSEYSDKNYVLEPFSPGFVTSSNSIAIPEPPTQSSSPLYFDRDGNAVFRLGGHPITFLWTLEGESVAADPSRQIYTVRMPRVPKGKIELTLDSQVDLSSSNVPFILKQDTKDEGSEPSQNTSSRTWELDCGLIDEITLVITDLQMSPSKNEGVFGAEQIDWIVQTSGLELNASFVFDSIATPKQITLSIDPRVRVRSITWDQQAIDWSFDSDHQSIMIDVPSVDGTYTGTQHRLVINGVSQWNFGADEPSDSLHRLPKIHLSKGLALDGRGSISLHSDWELINFSANDANLASRSGTTVRGGISRLDFNWRLSHPDFAIKLQRRKRLRTANVMMLMTSDRDNAIVTAKVRLNADSETWSTLPLTIGNGWTLETCEVENAPNLIALIVKDDGAQTSNIVISPAVENQILELSLRLRSNASSDNSAQFINLPRTIPFWLNEVNQTSVLEYFPPSGYALERTADSVHNAVGVTTLDTWHQSQILASDHAIQLKSNSDLLAIARFARQRPGISARSVLYVNKSWGATQCDYLLDCTPDQAGIQTLDLRLPSQAKNLIWRVLSKDRKEIQEWTWPDLTQINDLEPTSKPYKNVSLVCDRLLNEPFVLQCQYLLPSQVSDIALPLIANLVNRNSYVLTESDFQIELLTDKGLEDVRQTDGVLVRPDEQNTDIRGLLSFVNRPLGNISLYAIESQNITFRLKPNIHDSKAIVVDHSVETLYCQSDKSLLYELELDLADLNQNTLTVSLPKPWNIVSVSSNETEFQYVVRDIGERFECELNGLSENIKNVSSLKLRWLGPSVDLKRGMGSMSVPDVQGNFKSVSHISKILVHDNYLVPRESLQWPQRTVQNLKALSMPWDWGNDFIFNSNDSATSLAKSTDRSQLGYTALKSPIVRGSFRNFAINTVGVDKILPIADKRFVLLLRWIALAMSFIVATLIMRYSAWLAPWVICIGLLVVILTIETELIVATAIGLILATIVHLTYVVMRGVDAKQDLSTQEARAALSGIRQKSLSAANVARTLLVWIMLQNVIPGQEPEIPQERQEINPIKSTSTVVVPVDTNTLRIAPYAWINDRFDLSKSQANARPTEPVLLAAEHVIECKKNQDVLFKFAQKALITSTYRFRFDDDSSSITLPFNISNVKLNQFSVDGKVLTYSQNFYYSNSGLVWKPQRTGEFTVEVKAQFIQKPSEGTTVVQGEILPCAASQISIQTDISDLSLNVDGHPTEIDRSNTNLAIGKSKNLELRWRLESAASSIQYDAETRIFLDQGQPVAVTRMHIVGGIDRRKDLTLEWNRNWKPVGEIYRDATKHSTAEVWNIDYQRCKISMHPSRKVDGDTADLEIYWQPINDSFNSIAIPDPRIVEAIPNVRSLRYSKSAKSIWSVMGTDTWTPITNSSSSSLALPTANLTNTTLLRIPETGAAATLQNNFASQEKVNVQVHADYLIGSLSSSVHWRGSLVPSYVRTKTQSWIVDNRVTIESIRINNQEALFAVDRFSDQFNLVRAIGDSEGELLSSVEIAASVCGYATLANNKLPLINWCNVKVIQSSFNVSRLVGLPTTVENLATNVAIDGRLYPLNDSKYGLPFAERIAEGFESVPYELERPQIQNDEATVTRISETISQRDLAKVTSQLNLTSGNVVNCQAAVTLENDMWRLDFKCDLDSIQEGHGLVVALPSTDALRLKSKANITKLGEIGEAVYLYLEAERDFSDETRLHLISFWIEQKIDSTKTNFDIPEIDFISAPLMHCDLNVSYGTQKQDLIWDVSHWTKQDSSRVEREEATHATGSQLSRYVSVGKISAFHAEPKPLTKTNLQFPFAYWSLQRADDERLILEGLLAVTPQGATSAILQMPKYLQHAALIQLSGDGSESTGGWTIAQDNAGLGSQIPVSFRTTDLPHLIAVRGTIFRNALEDIEITDEDFRIITTDKKTIIPARSNFGLSEECDAASAASDNESFGVSNAIAMHSLTGELLGLLQEAKPSIDRLTGAQRDEYLSAWCHLIQKTGTSEALDGTDVAQSDWIAKYRQIFTNTSSIHMPDYIPSSFTGQTLTNWRSIGKPTLKFVNKMPNSKREYVYDFLTLCSWAVPLVLMTFVMFPIAFSEQLRSILRDYPWRLLCLIALVIAIIPSLLWLSLLLSCVALIICVVAFHRQYFGLS